MKLWILLFTLVSTVSIAHAGDKVAYRHRFKETKRGATNWNMDIFMMDVATGERTRLTKHRADDWNPAISPDGKWLAFITDRWSGGLDGEQQVALMNLETREIKRISGGREFWAHAPSFSPDSEVVYFSQSTVPQGNRAQGRYYVMSYEIALDKRKQLTFGPHSAVEPSASPDGKKLAYRSMGPQGQRILIFDLTTSEKTILNPERKTIEDEQRPQWRDNDRVTLLADYGERDSSFYQTVFETSLSGGVSVQKLQHPAFYDIYSICWFNAKRGVVSARDDEDATIQLFAFETGETLKVKKLTEDRIEWSSDADCMKSSL